MIKIGSTQEKIIKFIEYTREQTGESPTVREIAEHVGNTQGATFNQITRLINRGLLTRNAKQHRSLQVVKTNYIVPSYLNK